MPRSDDWNRVETLIGEQKFAEARTLCQRIRDNAQKNDNSEEFTEALIKEVQLEIGLSGYETAIRSLRTVAWPKDLLSQMSLELYYASSLVRYLEAYSFEINQRERIESKNELDLKSWNKDRIYAEAQAAYARLWARRAELSLAPIDLLGKMLRPGNYPSHVRGTLRDELSYFLVELLTNTQFWRPEESSELYRLDKKALLLGKRAGSETAELSDTKLHPLVRAMAVLDDLEAFHTAQGHLEAALEVRLQRVKKLHQAFTETRERAEIVAHLEERLPFYRAYPWWSMGMATLAELIKDGAHDLVHAYNVAAAGQRAYPNSPGGQACLYLQKSIEAPDFELEAMRQDGPNQRSVLVRHKNLERLHFRAYALNLIQRIESAEDYNLFLGAKEMSDLLEQRKSPPAAEWTVELAQVPDYKFHQTYVTPPLKQKGLYAIVASVQPDFRRTENRIFGTNFIVTDLVLVTRQEETQLEVSVVAASTGQPIAGATVSVYQQNYNRRHKRIASERTDAQGIVRLQKSEGLSCYLLAENGSDATIDPDTFYLYRSYEQPEVRAALVYTDRSIYRPEQTIFYKVVAYRGKKDEGNLKVAPRARLDVLLLDANNQEVAKKSLTSNDFGTAAGAFRIPSGRLLGNWRIEVRGGHSGFTSFQVEEYKRPTFELSLQDPEAPLRLNKAATLTGEARYFFGLPVTAGQVRYRVSREPVYPYFWSLWGLVSEGGERSQTVKSGSAPLSTAGRFQIEFTPEADEQKGTDISYRYLVKVELTDEGGETRSTERSFRLGFSAVEAGIEAESGFFPQSGGEFTVRRKNLDGLPRPGEGSYRVFALKQPAGTVLPADQPLAELPITDKPVLRTPGDKLRPRWQSDYSPDAMLSRFSDGGEKQSGKLVHDAQGVAKIRLAALSPGAYRLRYETTDEFGKKAEAWKDFIVAAPGDRAQALPGLSLPLVLRAEKEQVAVGEKARLLLLSGLGAQPIVVEVFRAGKLLRRTLYRGSELIEIPISEADRGGLGVFAWTVRDHQFLTQNLSLHVPWDNKELKLEFATFRDRLRPGAHETFRVIVRTASGAALAKGMAELLAYMYDRSLDLFAPHVPENPLSLFPFRGTFLSSRASVGAAGVHWVYNNLPSPAAPERLHGAALFFYDNYAIGGPGNRVYKYAVSDLVMRAPPMAEPKTPPPPPPPPPGLPNPSGLGGARELKNAKYDKDDAKKPEEKSGSPNPSSEGGPSPVRQNFAETAFFFPALLSDENGAAVLEFQVPDSVTSWNVWVHALTKDFSTGSLRKETRSIKDLMVRPYLPRFFREADSAELKVMVQNARTFGPPLSGTLRLEIFDPESHENHLSLFQVPKAEQPFTVHPGTSATLSFALSAPRRVGTYAFKVSANAGELGDGELRPLPVLPSRMHLAESRFVTLHDKDRRSLRFADLAKNDDPTRRQEQLVVTLDAQLFYTVLKALPFLVNYPYECVEQTLNRFVSTGIVSALYAEYPAMAKMAKEFGAARSALPKEEPGSKAAPKAALERFSAPDPNRKMTLEESPWLETAEGGSKTEAPLQNVLDPRIARETRDGALAKLRKAQTSLGGFPWFPGGPPSPFMTLYLMYGLAKASEFQVEVPKDMVQRGWQYLARHYREHYVGCLKTDDCAWEFLTLLNYVASAYPDASWTGDALTQEERQAIAFYSIAHWKQHSPYLKSLLALTLKRMGKKKESELVFASVMDAAKMTPDAGVYWAPEDRSWLWYRDSIESHAFALRTLLELDPQNPKKEGLVLWLLLNKKLNQWKSTRATAEVLYALVHYLRQKKALFTREEATVSIGPQAELGRERFVFAPDKYVGKTQLVLKGEKLLTNPTAAAEITVEKATDGFLFASATWHYSTDRLPSQGHGDLFRVERTYFKRELDNKKGGKEYVLRPIANGEVLHIGDEVEVHLSLRSRHAAEYVHLRDPRAAGLEPDGNVSGYRSDLGLLFYEEVRDSGTNFFFEALPQGEYTFKYRLRCNLAGRFRVGPATVQSMYAPEFSAFSAGHNLHIGG